MPLQLDNLVKSIKALDRSIDVVKANTNTVDDDLKETLRAGVIQHFEVAYEQSWKFIQRWIRENKTPEEAENPRTRKDLFRAASRYGLIKDPIPWFSYGEARNLTSHVYDEKTANTVYENAEGLLEDARFLMKKIAG